MNLKGDSFASLLRFSDLGSSMIIITRSFFNEPVFHTHLKIKMYFDDKIKMQQFSLSLL